MNIDVGPCYKKCNELFSLTEATMRIYCKKGCDADEETL